VFRPCAIGFGNEAGFFEAGDDGALNGRFGQPVIGDLGFERFLTALRPLLAAAAWWALARFAPDAHSAILALPPPPRREAL
jgi:hypothetical protein